MPKIQAIPNKTEHGISLVQTSLWADTWDRTHRQIFLLSDGYRDIARIGLLLHKSEAYITDVIDLFVAAGYINVRQDQKVVAMNAAQLRATLNVLKDKEAFAHNFYEELFQNFPETATLFQNTSWQRQYSSFMATLSYVVAGVERGENIVPSLRKLGEKHKKYGVLPSYYLFLSATLVITFSRTVGSAFTSDMRDAWDQALSIVTEHMLVGVVKEETSV